MVVEKNVRRRDGVKTIVNPKSRSVFMSVSEWMINTRGSLLPHAGGQPTESAGVTSFDRGSPGIWICAFGSGWEISRKPQVSQNQFGLARDSFVNREKA